MAKQPGPDPAQQPPRRQAARPGNDRALRTPRQRAAADPGDRTRGNRDAQEREELVEETQGETDAELLARSWMALAGHVGNFRKHSIIPPGIFQDAGWLRYLIRIGRIGRVEVEE